ncbi:MAG: UDP-N-acetylmuramate dehydrogenase [Motiliproteus sp.]
MQQNLDLRPFNSLAVSSTARYFTQVNSVEELKQALQHSRQQQLPVLLLGGGSNLVLTEDFPGLCIQISLQGVQWCNIDDNWVKVTAQAGENWHQFVDHCLQHGAYGLENLALIPGTVGAAPIQNIGAYGVDINDFMLDLKALNRDSLQMQYFSREDCAFGYRDSIFKTAARDRYIITEVSFKLRRMPKLMVSYGALADQLSDLADPSPQDLFDAVVRTRSAKLPDPNQLANVGSFFKNPVVSKLHHQRLKQQYPGLVAYADPAGMKLAAGWMIDHCGWKGYRKGDAGVHDKQALVLVNYGAASGAEVLALASAIQTDIKQHFDVELEIEPRCY